MFQQCICNSSFIPPAAERLLPACGSALRMNYCCRVPALGDLELSSVPSPPPHRHASHWTGSSMQSSCLRRRGELVCGLQTVKINGRIPGRAPVQLLGSLERQAWS